MSGVAGVNWRNRLLAHVDAHRDELIGLVQALVRIPSVFGAEGPCQSFVAEYLRAFADSVDVWELSGSELETHPAYFPRGIDYTGRPNVVGQVRGFGGGRSLLLTGHIDVVDPGPADKWTFGPWSGDIAGGNLYGRGSADMKAGVAVGLFCLKALREIGVPLAGNLIMASVADEEWGGGGTISLLQRGYLADGAILLEPTVNAICPASRGGMAFRVTVKGLGAHPVRAYKGVSAIEKACQIVMALKELETLRQARLRTPVFAEYPIFAPICIGKISADEMSSKVAEKCVMEGLYGYHPAEDYRDAKSEFEEWVAAAAAKDPWMSEHPPVVEWIGLNKEGAEIAADHPLVTTMSDCFEAANGHPGRVTALTCGCDLPHLIKYGRIPALVFGPGDCTVAHSTDEHVPIAELIDAAKAVCLMALSWCGLREG